MYMCVYVCVYIYIYIYILRALDLAKYIKDLGY